MTVSAHISTIIPETGHDFSNPYPVPFTPEAQIWFANNRTSDGQSGDYVDSFGVASSSQRVRTLKSEDATANSETAEAMAAASGRIIDSTVGAPTVWSQVPGFQYNGFSSEPTTDDGVDRIVSVLSLASFSNTKVGSFVTPSGTGNYDITDPGFDPDFVILFVSRPNPSSTHATVGLFKQCIGWFCRDGTQGVVAGAMNNASTTSSAYRYQRTSSCLAEIYEADGSVIGESAFVATLPTGFTLNCTTLGTAGYVYYAAFKGCSATATSLNIGDALETVSVTGMTFQPKVTLFMSYCAAAGTVGIADAIHSIGCGISASSRFCRIASSRDNQGTMQCDQTLHRDCCIKTGTMGLGGLILRDTADFTSNNTDGFTVTVTTASGVDKQVLALSLGDNPPTVNIKGLTKVLGLAKVM